MVEVETVGTEDADDAGSVVAGFAPTVTVVSEALSFLCFNSLDNILSPSLA